MKKDTLLIVIFVSAVSLLPTIVIASLLMCKIKSAINHV